MDDQSGDKPRRVAEEGTFAGKAGRVGVLIGTKSLSTAPGVHTHPEKQRPGTQLGPGGFGAQTTN